MISAWEYALSGVERGMTQTAALIDYRAGGGHIANEYWSTLYHLGTEAKESGELVTGLPFETPIPDQAYTVVDYKLERKYTVVADISYIAQDTGELKTRTISVQSDDPESWPDIEDHIDYVGGGYGVVGDEGGITINRARFYMPSSMAG